MNEKFALTDEGNLDYYQGVEFEYPDDMNLVMHQRGYAEKLLEKFGMKDANPVKTQLTPGISLQDSPAEVDSELQRKYREIIGSL